MSSEKMLLLFSRMSKLGQQDALNITFTHRHNFLYQSNQIRHFLNQCSESLMYLAYACNSISYYHEASCGLLFIYIVVLFSLFIFICHSSKAELASSVRRTCRLYHEGGLLA